MSCLSDMLFLYGLNDSEIVPVAVIIIRSISSIIVGPVAQSV
jgi:hypothetical protein